MRLRPRMADPPGDEAPATLAAAFRAAAARHPRRLALRDGDDELDYATLDARSDAVAAALAGASAAPNHVALLLSHGIGAVVALFGTSKAGAVFVPLDPTWPDAYLETVLRDAAVHTVVTDPDGARRLAAWPGRVVVVEGPAVGDARHAALALDPSSYEPLVGAAHASTGAPGSAVPAVIASDASASIVSDSAAAAAIYYSSGSIGAPKGVLLSHRSLLAYAREAAHALALAPDDRFVWLAPLAAGASKLPILGGLLAGAAVLPYALARRGLDGLAAWMTAERITVYASVPTLFRRFAATLAAGRHCPDLRAVKLGGEPVLTSDARLVRERFSERCTLWNGLGITETAGNVCWFRCDDALPDGATVPLGYPIASAAVNVVDEDGRPVAPGTIGEITVRAPHLALGYWNRPALTAQRFRVGADGVRTFLTGDLAVRAGDGCLSGRGRLDDACKIRGHRVDPALVEAALLAIDGVSETAVVARPSSDGLRLVAFVVASAETTVELRALLTERLPAPFVPSAFVAVDALPRLAGGKVDRRRLAAEPVPDEAAADVAPRDALEAQLVHVWAKALRRDRIGVTDDFFALGGDSLDAVRIAAMMERWLRVNLPLTTIARHPTIAALAAAIRADDPRAAHATVVLLNGGESRRPFFCVPGAGSDAFALVELARALGPEQTFYALQHPGLDGTRPRWLSIEAMAARFLPDLLAVQPHGPYYLGGTSFGGIVAYELARQLRARGETVALLALIETYGHDYPPVRLQWWPRDLPRLLVRWLLPIGRKNESSWPNLRLGVVERLERWRARLDLACPGRTVAPPYARRFIYLREVCFRAHRRYGFPPYDGNAVVFRAEQQPPATLYALADDLGWGEAVRGGLEYETVPGYHGAHIRAPHVPGLAAALGARLRTIAPRHEGRFDDLTGRTRDLWDDLGTWWDARIGDDGNLETRAVLPAAVDRLLGPCAGRRVLDVACGNGWYGRRLVRAGASVVGFDFSRVLVARAEARAAAAGLPIAYHVLDATRAEELLALGERGFDAAVCLMALMDVSDVDPLFAALARLVVPGGPVVFSIVHPDRGALARASSAEPLTGIGLPGEPTPHYYFHRPLAMLLAVAERSGFALDAGEDVTDAEGRVYFVGRLRAPAVRVRAWGDAQSIDGATVDAIAAGARRSSSAR